MLTPETATVWHRASSNDTLQPCYFVVPGWSEQREIVRAVCLPMKGFSGGKWKHMNTFNKK